MSTHCFILGYFNITCGAYASGSVLHFLPAKTHYFQLSFQLHLLGNSATVLKKVRKGGVSSFSYNFLLAKFLSRILLPVHRSDNLKVTKMPCLSLGSSFCGVPLFWYSLVFGLFCCCSPHSVVPCFGGVPLFWQYSVVPWVFRVSLFCVPVFLVLWYALF